MKWMPHLLAVCLLSVAPATAAAQDALTYQSRATTATSASPLLRHWATEYATSAAPSMIDSTGSFGRSVSRPIHDASFHSNLGGAAACSKGCKGDCCCAPVWAHRTGVFGEFLYLRPRDAEVAYAVEVDSILGPPDVQIGPIGITDPDYSPGYRAGAAFAIDDCTSIVATFSRLGTNTSHTTDVNPPPALRALLIHPGTLNAGANFLTGIAGHDVDFDIIDVDYRAVWRSGDLWALNYVVGARYGRIEQDFQVLYTNAGPTQFLATDIDFDGGGVRLGIDYERHAGFCGLMAYGKASASFLAGDYRGSYFEGSDVDPQIVNTSWKAGRVVPILDLELGGGWQSPCGHFRFTGGYMFSAWFNSLTTDEWIQAVHNNNFTGLDDTVTFDGFTARAEYRF